VKLRDARGVIAALVERDCTATGPLSTLEIVAAETLLAATVHIPMLLTCPSCGERHIDDGEWAAKSHHTHACQHCGMAWRPCVFDTVGVRFLPGFKNA
jgi:predicted RNA-binding Zn-ribbon protein involved in translation (DUF1610 family)